MSDYERRFTSEGSDMVWVDDFGPVRVPQDTVLSIANVASMFNVSSLSLHYYERRGLIARRHRVGRLRVYTWADCDRIAFIIKGRKVGLSVGEMAVMLKGVAPNAVLASITAGRAKCLELIDRLDRRRQPLRDALGELRRLHTMLAKKLVDATADRD